MLLRKRPWVSEKPPLKSLLEIITGLPELRLLNFDFRVTKPWKYVDDDYAVEDPFLGSRISCQQSLVDWFFTLAYNDLGHISCVTLSGHVKNR